MTAQFPHVPTTHTLVRRRPARRAHLNACVVAFCWLTAGASLVGSYAFGTLALQAASCLLGLAAVAAALLLTTGAEQRHFRR